ncbi:MAG: STAS domain-containing protein [bacterium]
MDIQIEGNKQSLHLVCSGNATVDASAEIRDALIDALQKSKKVIIDAGGVEKADISFLQLLISAEKTAQQKKKSIEIDPHSHSQPLIDAAVRAGFCREQEHIGAESMNTILATYRAQVSQEASDV